MRAKRWGALLALAGALLAVPAAGEQADDRYVRLYESLWSAVNDHYYDPRFRGTDWRAVGERYRARAEAVRSDDAFAGLAREMLGELGSSHLSIQRPAASAGAAGIGARTERIGDMTVVTEVASLSDAWRQGLRPGDRLLAPAAVPGPIGTPAALDIERCDGTRRSLAIRREAAFWPPERPGLRWRQIRTGADTRIGYFRIDRFDDGAAELIDRAMTELGETNALIIDVRGNSGGNASALRLASYFGPGAEAAMVLLSRSYLDALGLPPTPADIAAAPRVDRAYTDAAVFAGVSDNDGGAALWTEEVARPYRRPVFVLTGPETASAAEGFAWYMRLRTAARLVGRASAGELLSADRIDIGQGWRVVVPVHGLWGPDGEDYGDRAVPPHIATQWTRADLCSGRDPDLEAALRLADES